jgi:hypothetical protein
MRFRGAAVALDGKIGQFGQHQILYNASVFVIDHHQTALAIDFNAGGCALADLCRVTYLAYVEPMGRATVPAAALRSLNACS